MGVIVILLAMGLWCCGMMCSNGWLGDPLGVAYGMDKDAEVEHGLFVRILPAGNVS